MLTAEASAGIGILAGPGQPGAQPGPIITLGTDPPRPLCHKTSIHASRLVFRHPVGTCRRAPLDGTVCRLLATVCMQRLMCRVQLPIPLFTRTHAHGHGHAQCAHARTRAHVPPRFCQAPRFTWSAKQDQEPLARRLSHAVGENTHSQEAALFGNSSGQGPLTDRYASRRTLRSITRA